MRLSKKYATRLFQICLDTIQGICAKLIGLIPVTILEQLKTADF